MAADGRRLRILIAGGGLGGLTAALSLLQRGFEVQVFEQAVEMMVKARQGRVETPDPERPE